MPSLQGRARTGRLLSFLLDSMHPEYLCQWLSKVTVKKLTT